MLIAFYASFHTEQNFLCHDVLLYVAALLHLLLPGFVFALALVQMDLFVLAKMVVLKVKWVR